MNKFLLITSILFFSHLSNAQVEGRGLYCESNQSYERNMGFIFEEEDVYSYSIEFDKDKYSIKRDSGSIYLTSASTIGWYDGIYFYKFNRMTGTIEKTDTGSKIEYICKVAANKEELIEYIVSYVDNIQEEYDKSREGNIL